MAEEDDDDLELGDLRSVFSSMREADEDPPETGMAALMAAARAKADEMKPQPSLWSRFFAAVSRPPVLAFAAVIVLVGGGAVMFRHRAEMQEKVEAPAPTANIQPAPDEPKRDEAKPVDTRAETPAPTVEIAAPAEKLEVAPSAATKPKAPTPKQRKQMDEKIDRMAEGAMLDVETLSGKKQGAANNEAAKEAMAPVAAIKPSTAGPRSSAGEADSGLDKGTAPVAPGGASANGVDDLVKQCEAAANAGDCARVKQIASKISAQDDAVYRAKVLRNAKIAACLN